MQSFFLFVSAMRKGLDYSKHSWSFPWKLPTYASFIHFWWGHKVHSHQLTLVRRTEVRTTNSRHPLILIVGHSELIFLYAIANQKFLWSRYNNPNFLISFTCLNAANSAITDLLVHTCSSTGPTRRNSDRFTGIVVDIRSLISRGVGNSGAMGGGRVVVLLIHIISPVFGIGTPPTPHPQASVSPLLWFRGGHTRLREKGWGVIIPTRGHTLWYSILYMYFVN